MKNEEIDILLHKFYEGLSSEEEERVLKVFFTGDDVPAGYESEKDLFVFYLAASEVPEPSAGFEERIISAVEKLPGNRWIPNRRFALTFSGIAAGLLIMIVSWFLLSRQAREDTFRDPEIAYAETMKILYEVSSKLNTGAASLKPVTRMNITGVQGLKVLSRSKETLEKNLGNLDYFQKVIGITNITEEEKK
ncbi:MAG: hypothetical protein ACM3UT_01705 [Chloroflexota bacterium]